MRRSTPADAPFVGRSRELAQLEIRLGAGVLLSLMGPPGVGKTRLMRQYARLFAEKQPSIWVDAQGSSDPSGLWAEAARALGVAEHGAPGAGADARMQRLARGLAGHGPVLLVLDGVDALLSSLELLEGLTRLSAEAPEARLVVISRAVLRAPSAQSFSVKPLELPGSNDPQRVLASEAVQLLLQRAAGYRFRVEDARDVAQLVRSLDGLPLSIELAARRLHLLSPAALWARSEQHLDLLKSKASGGVSLRQVIAGAFFAEDEAARSVLAQCAVFRGELDASAAEAVVQLDGVDGEEDDGALLLDLLESLVDHSLLQAGDDPHLPRFRLLESIRSFAEQQLSEEQASRAKLRHAQYFACAELAPGDIANVSAAYAYACELPAAQGLPLRVALLLNHEPLSAAHMPVEPRLLQLDATLAALDAHPEVVLEPSELSRLLCERGRARQRLGEMLGAEADLTRGLALPAGPRVVAELACQLANLHLAQGHGDSAQAFFDRARAALSGQRDKGLEGRIELGLGLLAHSQGRLDAARAHYERAADAARLSFASHGEAEALAYLGTLWVQRGDGERARAYYEDALRTLGSGRDARLTALTLSNLAILEQERGRFDVAARCLAQALEAAEDVGDRMLEGHLTGYRGCLEHETGRLPEAQRSYEHAIALLREVGDVRLEAIFLSCLGSVYAERGLLELAHEVFDRAEERLAQLGDEGALAAVSLHRGQLLLARARAGQPHGSSAALLEEAARELLEAGRRDALHAASDDLRFAARLLAAGLTSEVMLVTMDEVGVLSFQPPGGHAHDLSSRLSQRRILGALLRKRLASPGEPLAAEALIAAGWPDERIGHDASMNRLKVALAALRKLDLRTLLQRKEGGYLLDPTLGVRINPT